MTEIDPIELQQEGNLSVTDRLKAKMTHLVSATGMYLAGMNGQCLHHQTLVVVVKL